MNTIFREAKLAILSLICVLAGLLFYGFLVKTGTIHRLGNSMDRVGIFAALSPCLIATVLAIAGLIWDRRKLPGVIALVIALAAILLIFPKGF